MRDRTSKNSQRVRTTEMVNSRSLELILTQTTSHRESKSLITYVWIKTLIGLIFFDKITHNTFKFNYSRLIQISNQIRIKLTQFRPANKGKRPMRYGESHTKLLSNHRKCDHWTTTVTELLIPTLTTIHNFLTNHATHAHWVGIIDVRHQNQNIRLKINKKKPHPAIRKTSTLQSNRRYCPANNDIYIQRIVEITPVINQTLNVSNDVSSWRV